MPSITIWTRLESDTGPSSQGYDAAARDRLLAIGAQGRVFDPLWLLGRQWQFGEFQGEDAGSPILAEIRVESSLLTAYLPSVPAAGSHAIGDLYPRDPASKAPLVPLDALVERERIHADDRTRVRLAAEAGLHLGRLLIDAGFSKYRPGFVSGFPLSLLPEAQLDPSSAAFQRIMAGRAADGTAVYAKLRTLNPPGATGPFVFPPIPAIATGDRDLVGAVLRRWLAWYETEVFSEPPATTPWIPERMEYRFAVAAPALPGQREAVLVAPAYGGDLDWHTFDRIDPATGTTLGATGAAETLSAARLIPAAVRYPGMAASRFWEFEDARVDLGAVTVQPDDLARLLLLEFSLIYGNDWFMVPLELVTGSLSRIAALDVVDTFGGRRTIGAAGEGDPGRRSRLFRVATAGSDATTDALLLPPVAGVTIESPLVERVRFARDEHANLVWAIERIVESQTGRPIDLGRAEAGPPPAAGADSSALAYRVMSTLPRHWLPLVPPSATAPAPVKLVLGSVLNDGVVQVPAARGRIIPPDLALAAEEVTRDGLDVARLYRYARWVDGSTHLWAARRRRPASGEASSVLQFDYLVSSSSPG